MITASVVSTSKAAAGIRAAAIEAFAEHGYGGTTTRDIAARPGLSAAAADGSFAVSDAEGMTVAIVSLCDDVCRWFPAGRYAGPGTVAKLHSELALRLINATTE